MSLSKPENLLLVGASALVGVALAAILNRDSTLDKHKQDFGLEKVEEKQVGKQRVLQRGKTGINLDRQMSSTNHLQDIQAESEEALELRKLIKKQQEMTQQLLQLAAPIVDRCPHLVDLYGLAERFMVSPLIGDNLKRSIFGGGGFLPKDAFMQDDSFVIAQKDHSTMREVVQSLKFTKGGPREHVFFNPKTVKAAIVTCGGLCPGLNVVIREIVMSLYFNYEAHEIYGIQWGYKGFYTNPDKSWIELTPQVVKNIHKLGGTILGSSRGGFQKDKILDEIQKRGINQVYIIGGDGTHRGINELIKRAMERRMIISFVGIPKTIDNDIPIIDNSFGFNTACEVAERMIEAAYTEATNAQNGIGLVKLMGRYSGFIARNASLANGNVDMCLIPELPFELEGPKGFYEQIITKLKEQNHCVIVVAEGAEEGLINPNEKITQVEKRDDSNNLIFDDIGKFLRDAIPKYAKTKHQMAVTLKYIDPTYAIRSVPANAVDTIMCAKLAQNAVHGAMSGYTGFSVGVVRNAVAYIPITTLIDAGVNRVSMTERTWQRLMAQNRQKYMINDDFKDKAWEVIRQKQEERKQVFRDILKRVRQQHDAIIRGSPVLQEAEIDNA
ncbi:6-phosphofructokinase 3-like [Stylonychia lemnae]|uniref:6-phosphofructokinase 3-like n=1 Tax=Stylonychia lemnae TaxID=5949 RepID=A0A078B4T4_STYLE|nr:6-phosphofructokinase 3-like [Stylonychia lemnae]|eukprot:CDW89434.1 6-phosphofructokinase 3-like [Stylonychia lemnae]